MRQTIDSPGDLCVHELFERQAALIPDAIAVVSEEKQLTYAELNERANQLAHYLRSEHGVGPEVCVTMGLERSAELVITMLGILKAGGAYVPVDPTYPTDRLGYVLRDSAAPVLITDTTAVAALRKALEAGNVALSRAYRYVNHASIA